MAAWIDRDACRGCGNCVEVCPGDLLFLAEGKALLREPGRCWLCLSCAKVCPEEAIRGRLPFVLADSGASLWPRRTPAGFTWICERADGSREVFAAGRGE